MSVGQINGSGDATALFRQNYSTDILAQYPTKTVTEGLIQTKKIDSGKNYFFPVTGRLEAEFHTRGTAVTGQELGANRKEVKITGELLVPHTYASIDEAMSDFDLRSSGVDAQSQALGRGVDRMALASVANGASASALVTGGYAGTKVEVADGSTANFKAAVTAMAAAFDEKDIAEDDRYLVVTPTMYYQLVNDGVVINRDYNGDGSIAKGMVGWFMGFQVVKSNHIPKADYTSAAIAKDSKFAANYTGLVACAFVKDAVAKLELTSLDIEDIRLENRQTRVDAAMAIGVDWVRPEGCGVIHLPTYTL